MDPTPTNLQLNALINSNELDFSDLVHTNLSTAPKVTAVHIQDGRMNVLSSLVSSDLLSSLNSMPTRQTLPRFENFSSLPDAQTLAAPGLDTVFQLICKDVYTNRHLMMNLPTVRRAAVEKRLEHIARKVARSRGERMNRSLTLTDLLRESFHPSAREKTLGQIALERFSSEVALHYVMQLFIAKSLDQRGWRTFTNEDLGRFNFVMYEFLKFKSLSFNQDRHSWQFVRPNLYSWYNVSPSAQKECSAILAHGIAVGYPGFCWSATDLASWIRSLPPECGLTHLDIAKDSESATFVLNFLERQMGTPLVSAFQGQALAKKIFIPAVEGGGFALACLDRISSHPLVASKLREGIATDPSLHQSIWCCESEGLETFYTEISSILMLLHRLDVPLVAAPQPLKLPHGVRAVQTLALELHNQEQLALGEAHVSQQGSAQFIQDFESFDLAVVIDHPDRLKSSRWLKKLSELMPYWSEWLNGASSLNWGEGHLHLALSKMKEHGHCVYLTHKVLTDQGEGERFRKQLLGLATLDYFLELPEDPFSPYRYMYIFTRESSKKTRDAHRVRYGRLPTDVPPSVQGMRTIGLVDMLETKLIEESSCSQWEISERGWDQIFVKGSGPLIRHLNHRFPKLFQFATVQSWSPGKDPRLEQGSKASLFTTSQPPSGIEFTRDGNLLRFTPLTTGAVHERIVIFPHNASDLPWMLSLLNSKTMQFWIKMQVTQDPGPVKILDLRNLPLADLTRVSSIVVDETVEWLGRNKHTEDNLKRWIAEADAVGNGGRFVAIAKRRQILEQTAARYSPLFDRLETNHVELNPEAVPRFYQASLLISLLQSSDVRTQFVKRELSTMNPNHWIVKETFLTPHIPGRAADQTIVHIFTKQGPQIMLSIPSSVAPYVNSQLQKLRDFTWGEVQGLLRVPSDISLYCAQSSEIVRVVGKTLKERDMLERVLDDLSCRIYEVPTEDHTYVNKTSS